jgi:hypothetical protein
MSTFHDQQDDATALPEDVAHRVLARAIELEASHGPSLTVAQLREIAREAGIPTHALDRALRELPVAPLPAASAPRRRPFVRLLGSVLALGSWWIVLRTGDHVAMSLSSDPRVPLALDIGVTVAAAAVALRCRMRVAAGALAAFAAAQLVAYPLLALQVSAPVGSLPVWGALTAAGLLGVGAGAALMHRRTAHDAPAPSEPPSTGQVVSATLAESDKPRASASSLRVRLASLALAQSTHAA